MFNNDKISYILESKNYNHEFITLIEPRLL